MNYSQQKSNIEIFVELSMKNGAPNEVSECILV